MSIPFGDGVDLALDLANDLGATVTDLKVADVRPGVVDLHVEMTKMIPLPVHNVRLSLFATHQAINDMSEATTPETKPGLTFGEAIEAMKAGHRVARRGWNGKGMYLWMLPGAMVKAEWCKEPHLKSLAEANGGEIECLPAVRMLTADKKVLTGWLASQTDMFATDWEVLP